MVIVVMSWIYLLNQQSVSVGVYVFVDVTLLRT